MPTFKDIAELAGVSYGTVSNVYNGKGNVSSDKIRRVHQAAAQLGYTPNESAHQLRLTTSNVLAVILPNLTDHQYTDFFTSFRFCAEAAGYRTVLYLSDNNARRESALVSQIRAAHPAGVAVISVLNGTTDPYMQMGFKNNEVLFAEQRPFVSYDYVGFDFRAIGAELGRKAANYRSAVLITEAKDKYVSQEILAGFLGACGNCRVNTYEKMTINSAALSLDILGSAGVPDAIFTVISNHAEMLRSVWRHFTDAPEPDIYTLSTLRTMPDRSENKYELNYRLLGRTAVEQLIRRVTKAQDGAPETHILPAAGFRTWIPSPVPETGELVMLTLDSPTAIVCNNMAKMYTKYTGVPVRVSIYPYDSVHSLLTNMDESTPFDIIRLDATWMSWFAPSIFEPLVNLDPNVEAMKSQFLPNSLELYGRDGETLYALPQTPSNQMLFYRRDLFEDPAVRRLYQEKSKTALRPPQTFAEFNRIASFFTKAVNPLSPVSFGSTLTLGNTGSAATEFLSRYFALTNDLFDNEGRILLDSPAGLQALTEMTAGSRFANPDMRSWWMDTARTFAEGDTAMTILYSNYASAMLRDGSKVRGRIGYAMVPGSNPLYGGGSIGVCRYSKKKQLAYHFIRWLCSETVSTAMSQMGSVSPCRDTYQNYKVIDTYPWLSMSTECFEKYSARRFPPQPTRFDERRFLQILGTQVLSAIEGNCTPEEALKTAARQYGEG